MATEYVPHTGPIVTRAEAKAAGLTRYFTGRPCQRGHLSQRRTVNHACTVCEWKKRNRAEANAAERARHARNPGYFKRHYAANAERIKARTLAAYHANPGPTRARVKEWRERHPDRVLELRQAWYEVNKPIVVQRVTDWNAAHPEAKLVRCRNYRARVNGAEGSHTAADISALFDAQGGACVYCKRQLGAGYHVDHIHPLSRGGSNWPTNLQLLCARCNNNKRATDPAEYARRLTMKGNQDMADNKDNNDHAKQEQQAKAEQQRQAQAQKTAAPADKAAADQQAAQTREAAAAASIGAQIILDYNEDGSLGARGGIGTMAENIAARDAHLAAMGLDPAAPSGPPLTPEALAAKRKREEAMAADPQFIVPVSGKASRVSSLAAGINAADIPPPDPPVAR